MRQMRQNTKIIMLVTALAFVALMVFEWGMDMSGRSGGGGSLGRVGGTTVSVQQYQNTVRNLYNQIQASQEEPISSQQNNEIDDMAWDQVVNQILVQDELDRRGIRVTDDEVRRAARVSPPPEFQQDPAFQNEQGQFDLGLYQQFIGQAGQDPQFLLQLEQYYRQLLPRNKLIRQVTAGVFVTDEELWQRYVDRNERVEATFIAVDPEMRVPDTEIEVTPAEVEQYYDENEEDFEVPATANIRYTFISKAPTAADSAAALEQAREIRQRIVDGGEDFAELARSESGDQASAQAGGDLGAFMRNQLEPAFEEAAFSLPIGDVSEPVQTSSGYHIIEVTERNEEQEQVRVRHILVPIERGGESEVRLLTRADSLETLAEDSSMEEAAAAFGLEVREGEIDEEVASLPLVGRADEAQDWIFTDQEGLGATSPLFENSDVFYMIELLDESPARTLTLEEVSGEIEAQLRRERKTARTMEVAQEWAERLRSGTASLEELAEEIGVAVQTAGPFSRMDFVPGLGQASPAVGVAFGVPVGEVGGPVVAQDRIVLLRVDEKTEASREAWEQQKEVQRGQLTNEIQQARLDQWIEGLRAETRIVDNRAEYFRAAEEQAEQGFQQMPGLF
ncbi:MAG: peptidylprolyl isomerase [Gemmatimonadota bacterium]